MTLSSYFPLAPCQQLRCWDHKWKQHSLALVKPPRRKFQYYWIPKSVLNSRSSSSISDNGETEPARIHLERLFAQTQKLEQQIGSDPSSTHAAQLGVNLGTLESDLCAALAALNKKEEDLRDLERNIFSEYREINRAKEDLEQREKDVIASRVKQEKLEEELRLANIDLASQAREIDDLKLRLKEKDEEILASQSALSDKEDEILKMKHDLVRKNEEVANAEFELKSKAKLLDETNEIVKKQKFELQQLQRAIQKKNEEVSASISMQKREAEKLKVAEAKLETQTMDWLLAQEELTNLAGDTSKLIGEVNETREEFGRVMKLLSDVRSELVSTQSALASSRQMIDSQDQLLEKQLKELEEQRMSVMSYMTNLRNAEEEVESERAELRLAEAQNKELERDLSMERELVCELQKELEKERLSLKRTIQEMAALGDEIEHKSAAFDQTQTMLKDKESELVEARVEIQKVKSEQDALQLILEEKDLELSNTKKMLEEVNREIVVLNGILLSREDELIQATSLLKGKDEHVQTIQHELSHAQIKFSEAEIVVEKIVELTQKVVLSLNDEENHCALGPFDPNKRFPPPLLDSETDGFKWQKKQLEVELEFTRESLRTKEVEILAAQKALAIKDAELKIVLQKLDAGQNEITQLKGDATRDKEDLKRLYALAQERISDMSVADLAIEKLQLEAAQLDVEAATSALHKIAEMSRELLNKAGVSIEADYASYLSEHNGSEVGINMVSDSECPGEVKSEISRLLIVTEKLVKESGIAHDTSLYR